MMKIDKVDGQSQSYIGQGAIALTILAGIMFFTNPPREDYLSYASDKLSAELKGSVCQESEVPEFLKDFSGTFVKTCNSLVSTQRGLIKGVLDNSTTRKNALFFSLYTTEIAGYRYQTIGAFGNFLTFPTEKPKSSGG